MEKQLKVVSIENVKEYDNNPRLNESGVQAVAESIKQCGYISPVIIDENNIILAGHTRLRALKELDYKEIPAIICSGLTEEQKIKFRILDNKTAELATWDYNKLSAEIEDLDFDGFDFQLEEVITPYDFGCEFELPDGDKSEIVTMSVNLKQQQWELIQASLDLIGENIAETFGNENKKGNQLYTIFKEWFDMKEGEA